MFNRRFTQKYLQSRLTLYYVLQYQQIGEPNRHFEKVQLNPPITNPRLNFEALPRFHR